MVGFDIFFKVPRSSFFRVGFGANFVMHSVHKVRMLSTMGTKFIYFPPFFSLTNLYIKALIKVYGKCESKNVIFSKVTKI